VESTALRCGEAIRQEPREERIGNTVERGDTAGARRNATRRAGFFFVVGSSKDLPVFPDTGKSFSCPRRKIPPAQIDSIRPNLLYMHCTNFDLLAPALSSNPF